MDNLFCTGTEQAIQDCPFAGWKKHDCGQNEAAGVICRTRMDQIPDQGNSNFISSSPKPARSPSNANGDSIQARQSENSKLVSNQ